MKKCSIALFVLVISIFIGIFLVGCGGGGKTVEAKVLKLSHNHANGYPVDIAYKKFAEIIETNSGGRFKIEIYPSSQLGDQKASLELAKSDVIQFAHINGAVLEGFDQIYSVLNLPYIFKDYDHYNKVMNSDKIIEVLESTLDKGFVTLVYIESGARSIYTKNKTINTPADLKGLKIRVQDSPTSIDMIKALGATPIVLNFSEVYTSLQQGIVDGAENNFPSFVETGHSEVAKNISLTEHMRLSDFLTVGAPFWKTLDEKDKQMFRDAAKETEQFFAGIWDKSEKGNMDRAVNEYKVTITKPDITPFRTLLIPMQDNLGKKDPRFKELIDYIRSLE